MSKMKMVPSAAMVLAKHMEVLGMPLIATRVNMIIKAWMSVMEMEWIAVAVVPVIRPMVALVPVSVVSGMLMIGLMIVVVTGVKAARRQAGEHQDPGRDHPLRGPHNPALPYAALASGRSVKVWNFRGQTEVPRWRFTMINRNKASL